MTGPYRGPIKSGELLRLSQVYCYHTINRWLDDSQLKVSDIDGVVECNGHFLFFEFKCNPTNKAGSPLKAGQRKLWESMLTGLGNQSLLVVAEHKDLRGQDLADPMLECDTYHCWYHKNGTVHRTPRSRGNVHLFKWLITAWREKILTGANDLDEWLAQNAA